MTIATPAYLRPAEMNGHSYGRVTYQMAGKDRVGFFVIEDCNPAVHEMAKRVFPGCSSIRGAPIRFRANKRMVGELSWLMQRWPMTIECPEAFDRYHHQALQHAQRRDRNTDLKPASPPASFLGDLFPYQAEGVSFLLKNERTLLADDMGLGKTVVGLAALATCDAFPALIVVPASVQLQWQAMAQKFLELPVMDFLFDPGDVDALCTRLKGRKTYPVPRTPLVVCHYGLLRSWRDELLDVGFKAIIFDEIQELRHATTQKYSAASVLSEGVDYVWGLSGTPIYNQGAEIWSVLNILDYHCLGDFESFTREWCMGYGQKVVAKPKVLRDHLMREGLMIRRRKADVQKDLPPKRRVVTVVEKDDDTYNRLIQKAVDLAEGYGVIKSFTEKGRALREMDTAARMAAGVAKAPHVARFVMTLLEAGEKVLVYSWHHVVHNTFREMLSAHNPVMITGKQSPEERQEAVDAFAKGEADVVLLSLRTTAGLDGLQGRGTCVVFAELDWSPAVHAQCEDRLHRIGSGATDSLLCYYLVSNAGHDEVIQEALGLKIGQFTGIMGDAPESEDDRALAQQAAQKKLSRIVDVLKREGGARGRSA